MADILHRAKNEPSFAFYLPLDKPLEKRHFEQKTKPSGYPWHVKVVEFRYRYYTVTIPEEKQDY